MIRNRPQIWALWWALLCPWHTAAGQTPSAESAPVNPKAPVEAPDGAAADIEKKAENTAKTPSGDRQEKAKRRDPTKVTGAPETKTDGETPAPASDLVGAPAPADADAIDHAPDAALNRFRTPFEVLSERAIGRTSRRVRFDWRRSTVHVGAIGALPAELNNFDSLRAGGLVRVPYDGLLLAASFSHVWVDGSVSTKRLALTPYRQPARPDRYELDFAVTYPLAEGIVTAVPYLIPATQLVLNAHAHFRYLIYPSAFADLGFKDTLKAIVSASLSQREVANLEDERLPGMEIDPGRYGLLVGLGNDLYLQSGLFLAYEILVAVPLLAGMTDSELRLWFELSLAVGVAF